MPDQEFKIAILSTADNSGFKSAADAANTLKVDTSDLSDEWKRANGFLKPLNDEIKKVPSSADDAGEGWGRFSFKGREAREIVGELNRALPELGSVLRGLGIAAEESGAAVAAGEGEVAAGAEAVQSSILPLLAIMLAVKAAMEYWDLYEDKVKAMAAANDAAMQQIVDSTNKAMKAAQALGDVLNPKKKDMATHDEDALKKKLKDIEEAGEREKAVNKANEHRELGEATTPEQRKQIQDRYQQMDEDLDESQQLKKAQAEADAGEQARKQIADIKQASDQQIEIQRRAFDDKKKAGEEIDQLERSRATATMTVLTPYGSQSVPDPDKNAEIDGKIAALKKVQEDADKAYAQATAKQEELKKGAGDLGEKRQQFSDESQVDVDEWAQRHDTNRTVAAVNKQSEAETRLLHTSAPNSNETLEKLLEETGKTHQQIENILRGILGHTLNLGRVMTTLQSQLDQQKAQSQYASTQQ